METLSELKKRERGFFYALPGLLLAAFHMVVAYAVLPVGNGMRDGDFLPGLFEGVIGVVLYGGLACCVIMAIFTKRCSAVLEYIGIVTVARLLLPVIGRIGGELVIGLVVVMIFLMFGGIAIVFLLAGVLGPIFGGTVGAGLSVAGVVYLLFPVMGVIVLIAMAVSALTGAFEGAGLLGQLFTKFIPLL